MISDPDARHSVLDITSQADGQLFPFRPSPGTGAFLPEQLTEEKYRLCGLRFATASTRPDFARYRAPICVTFAFLAAAFLSASFLHAPMTSTLSRFCRAREAPLPLSYRLRLFGDQHNLDFWLARLFRLLGSFLSLASATTFPSAASSISLLQVPDGCTNIGTAADC